MRLKITRMSTAVAGLLYSHVEGDWNKIYVKKEHVEFLVNFLYKLYRHPNMKLDEYSRQQRSLENLGDMSFMENIVKYIDIGPLYNEEEFTDKALQQIFYDYLERVFNQDLYIVDAKTDKIKTYGHHIHMGIMKLINVLISRHCLIRVKSAYRKTVPFNDWLAKIIEGKVDVSKFSNILEPTKDKSDTTVIKKLRKTVQNIRDDEERKAG
jgi:hypothetical protein